MNKFAKVDNDVSLFQRIFCNECEEDFRLVLRELKKSIRDLTMVQVMSRHPTKDQGMLTALLDRKLSEGMIHEEEWKSIVEYLYNAHDSATLCLILRKQAQLEKDDRPAISAVKSPSTPNTPHQAEDTFNSFDSKSSKSPLRTTPVKAGSSGNSGYSSASLQINVNEAKATPRKKNVLKLSFPTFINIVVDFQLRSHQEYLSVCLKTFRAFDRDVDGVLNAAEFKEFFHAMRRIADEQDGVQAEVDEDSEEELQTLYSLLKMIDPLQTDRITFSSAVSCMQQYHKSNNGNEHGNNREKNAMN